LSAAALLIGISPPTMRGRAAGAWATGFLVGSMVGPLVGGVLTAASPRAPFLAPAGVLGVVVVIAGVALRGPVAPCVGAEQPPVLALPVMAALRHPTFRAALTANFVYGWTVYGVRVALVPLSIVDQLGLSSGWSGQH
jgi:MFS transporter, DHA1 family, tetracycline resistance protein